MKHAAINALAALFIIAAGASVAVLVLPGCAVPARVVQLDREADHVTVRAGDNCEIYNAVWAELNALREPDLWNEYEWGYTTHVMDRYHAFYWQCDQLRWGGNL